MMRRSASIVSSRRGWQCGTLTAIAERGKRNAKSVYNGGFSGIYYRVSYRKNGCGGPQRSEDDGPSFSPIGLNWSAKQRKSRSTSALRAPHAKLCAMRPCIFCGNPADSKEDLFPRWILKRVVTRQPLYRQMGDAPPAITEDQEVRIPCVCKECNNTWMSGMETTLKKFLGPMIEDFSLSPDRQNQQNLAEWAVKGAMINDAVDPHPRFFTDAECYTFKQKRTIPDRTLVFAARFTGRSLDSNGVDFSLIDPRSGDLLVRGHVYNVMVGKKG